MARQEIILGTPPQGLGGDPPRVASMKINAMTLELYQAAALATNSGWGGSIPVAPEGTDANTITGNRIIAFNNGANLPNNNAPYWFIETFSTGDNSWIAQRAVGLTQKLTYTRFKHQALGWQPWVQVLTGGGTMDEKRGVRDSIDISVPYLYTSSMDAMTPASGLILGLSYVSQNTTGTKPPGTNYGVLNTISSGGTDHFQQELHVITGQPGVSNDKWHRTGYGGQWGAWRKIFDSVNSFVDPQGMGSIMSSAQVGEWWVTKYASGMVCAAGPGPVVNCPANTWIVTAISVPTSISIRYTTATVNLAPHLSHDHYGVTTVSATALDQYQFAIRNGTVAQNFNTYFTVWGRWR